MPEPVAQFRSLSVVESTTKLLRLPGPAIGPLVSIGACFLLIVVKTSAGKPGGCYWRVLAASLAQQLLTCCPKAEKLIGHRVAALASRLALALLVVFDVLSACVFMMQNCVLFNIAISLQLNAPGGLCFLGYL